MKGTYNVDPSHWCFMACLEEDLFIIFSVFLHIIDAGVECSTFSRRPPLSSLHPWACFPPSLLSPLTTIHLIHVCSVLSRLMVKDTWQGFLSLPQTQRCSERSFLWCSGVGAALEWFMAGSPLCSTQRREGVVSFTFLSWPLGRVRAGHRDPLRVHPLQGPPVPEGAEAPFVLHGRHLLQAHVRHTAARGLAERHAATAKFLLLEVDEL